jgi:hypothetical protein
VFKAVKIFLLCFLSFSLQAQTVNNRTIAILDLTARNTETNDAELYSIKHILKVSGLPFVVTQNVDSAKLFGLVIASSKLDVTTNFTSAEKDSIVSYVNNGGVFVASHVKDSVFNNLFGISGYSYSTQRYAVKFNMLLNDGSFRWLNDSMEQTISLGDTSYSSVFGTRSYTTSGALSLAYFDDTSVAVSKNTYGQGKAYALGFSFKNLVVTNQTNNDYDAQRLYSNGFEPTSDAVTLLIKAICTSNITRTVWLHTSPYNSRNTLMVTHDVDATTAFDTMHYYADYENSIGLKTTYLITTHYINDGVLSDFYNIFTIPKVQYLLDEGHFLGSHSVGHFVDFCDEAVFPIGTLGNTAINYLPYNAGNSTPTTGGTIFGETETSKLLLENDFGINCRTFRAGYLCFPDKLVNALDTLGYEYNTNTAAGDVLTTFPYRSKKNANTDGLLTNVWEIPVTISDVFYNDPINTSNYPQKVAIWLDVIQREQQNYAPVNLLIHPTRYYKLTAQQDLFNNLPSGVLVTDLETFADYWRSRDTVKFSSSIENNILTITINSNYLPLHNGISFIVDSGQTFTQIVVQDENANPISFMQSNWEQIDIILHFGNYPVLSNNWIKAPDDLFTNCFPNPFTDKTTIKFRLDYDALVTINVHNVFGDLIHTSGKMQLNAYDYEYEFDASELSAGTYFYTLHINNKSTARKMIIIK